MKTVNVGRKLNRLLILGMATSLLIGCGPGFRAANFAKNLPEITDASKGGTDDNNNGAKTDETPAFSSDEINKKPSKDTVLQPSSGDKPQTTPIISEKPKDDKQEAPKDKPTADKAADDKLKSDDLTVVFANEGLKGITVDSAKESLKTVKAELAHYLEGLTVTVRSAGEDKKAVVEVLAVIKRDDDNNERIYADGAVSVEEKNIKELEANILLLPTLAAAQSADNMYRPAKNTKVGAVCGDDKCETLWIVMRSKGKLNKEKKIFDLTLELKRHGQSYQIVGSNASDKPLLIKSYHEAE